LNWATFLAIFPLNNLKKIKLGNILGDFSTKQFEKIELGNILGDFSTNSSGHTGNNTTDEQQFRGRAFFTAPL
jgi:hypothetical protein